jgi:hypothetical protein
MILKHFLVAFTLVTISLNIHAQTTLVAGDMAIIGWKSSGDGNGGEDAVKLITFVPLDCNTKFIFTDNNWNASTVDWFCGSGDAEFAIEITITSPVNAGTIFKIDVGAANGNMTVSTGTATKVGLGGDWGTNYGLNSGGDDGFILQGTRTSPTFIFGLKNCGNFSLGGSCTDSNVCGGSNKNNTGLPPGLTIGTTAIQNLGEQNRPYYNCAVSSGTKSELLAAICIVSNWANAASSNAGFTAFMSCAPTVTDAIGVYTSCGVLLDAGNIELMTSCEENKKLITWFSQEENKNYENVILEYSYDNQNYYTLQSLNSFENNKVYQFNDNSKDNRYYRIRYSDNGLNGYSNLVKTNCKSEIEFTIFPNPAKDLINFEISKLKKGDSYSVFIYNLIGEIIYIEKNISSQKTQISTTNFAEGVYYFVFQTEGEKQMQKLIITK